MLQQKIDRDSKERRIIELESTIGEQQTEILRLNNSDEERKKLEKLIQEQQKIIKLALLRIVPRKPEDDNQMQFCLVNNLIKGRLNHKTFYCRNISRQ